MSNALPTPIKAIVFEIWNHAVGRKFVIPSLVSTVTNKTGYLFPLGTSGRRPARASINASVSAWVL